MPAAGTRAPWPPPPHSGERAEKGDGGEKKERAVGVDQGLGEVGHEGEAPESGLDGQIRDGRVAVDAAGAATEFKVDLQPLQLLQYRT